jgi:hypothetical protein
MFIHAESFSRPVAVCWRVEAGSRILLLLPKGNVESETMNIEDEMALEARIKNTRADDTASYLHKQHRCSRT